MPRLDAVYSQCCALTWQSEEEHAGGCIAYPCFDLGDVLLLRLPRKRAAL